MPCDKAGIFILDGESFVLMQGAGFPDHCASRLAVSSKHGLLAECVESKRIMIASGVVSDSPGGHVPRYLDDVRCSLVAPLVADGRVIGVILLCCTTDNEFEPDQCQLMSLLTGKVASTVLSSRTLRRIYLEAETDTVTGLPNTRAVFRKLETELQRAQREGETVAVLFMDLNDLKPVNDSFGHAAGDTLLLEVGRALKRCLRPYDFLGRVGGDEFLAIVPGVAQDQLSGKVQVLKSAIATTAFRVKKDATIHTSVSVGAAVYPADTSEAEELVYLSDKRMYEDKQRTKLAPNWTSQTLTSAVS
jgi:diguanylate cyclase (GGDEF)-like protein